LIQLDKLFNFYDSQLSSTLDKADAMISQIEVTAEITLSDYIAYVALGQSTINFFMCCIACQCFRKLLQRHFEKLPERQIPPQTMAVTTR